MELEINLKTTKESSTTDYKRIGSMPVFSRHRPHVRWKRLHHKECIRDSIAAPILEQWIQSRALFRE
jgi:hypothetical protein